MRWVYFLSVLLGLQAAVSGAYAQAVPAGQVGFAIGTPTATGRDNRARPLRKGAPIFESDLIHTGAGRVQLRFTDGGVVSLQPNTQFKVEQYQFAGKKGGAEKGVFNLVKGGMRTITGLIGKSDPKNYRVTTKVATIGIRGTAYSLLMTDTLHGNVSFGQIDVCNGGGCTPFAGGQSFVVTSESVRPAITLRKAALSAPTAPDRKSSGNAADTARKAPTEKSFEVALIDDKSTPSQDQDRDTGTPKEDSASRYEDSGPGAGHLVPNIENAPSEVLGPPLDSGSLLLDEKTPDTIDPSPAPPLTGSHHLMIATARFPGGSTGLFGISAPFMGQLELNEFGQAVKVGSFNLAFAKGGSTPFSAGGEGNTDVADGSRAFHFAAGYPTLPFDMQWLQLNAPIATYTAFAGSAPTGFFGAPAPGAESQIGRFLNASMTANFVTSVASFQMNLEFSNTVLGLSSANLAIAGPNAALSGATTFGGGCSANFQCRVDGFFVGPKATQAMVVYEFGGAPVNGNNVTARGMVAMEKK